MYTKVQGRKKNIRKWILRKRHFVFSIVSRIFVSRFIIVIFFHVAHLNTQIFWVVCILTDSYTQPTICPNQIKLNRGAFCVGQLYVQFRWASEYFLCIRVCKWMWIHLETTSCWLTDMTKNGNFEYRLYTDNVCTVCSAQYIRHIVPGVRIWNTNFFSSKNTIIVAEWWIFFSKSKLSYIFSPSLRQFVDTLPKNGSFFAQIQSLCHFFSHFRKMRNANKWSEGAKSGE